MTRTTRKLSPITPPHFDAHATKEQRAKAVLLSDVAVVAQDPRAQLPLTTRHTHATIVPKEKEIPHDNNPKAKEKAKTTRLAALALAHPNLNPVLTVVAPVTTLAIASNALLMRKQQQPQSNKQIKTL